MLLSPRRAPLQSVGRCVRSVHGWAACAADLAPWLPRYVPNRPSAAPTSSGVTVCRFPTGSALHAPGDAFMARCRRQWQGVALNVYARRRPASVTTAASATPPHDTNANTTATVATRPSATRRSSVGRSSPLLPCPARPPAPSLLLHVSVLSNKRRVSRLAPLRNRARRRLSAAVMSVLAVGARGGVDVWVDCTLASGLVSARSLRLEAEEAMQAVGALHAHKGATSSPPSQATAWRQRLTAVAATRGNSPPGSSAQPAPSLSLPLAGLPVSMQLAISLHSHSSAALPGAALLSRLSHLCSAILQPPVTPLSRHSAPFLLLQPYTSRHHKLEQRRQLRQCVSGGIGSTGSMSSGGQQQLGARQVEECVHWLTEREGESRQEAAAVLCEARAWLSYMLHDGGSHATSNI